MPLTRAQREQKAARPDTDGLTRSVGGLALKVAEIVKQAFEPLTGDAANATKEKAIAEIVGYVERVAAPCLARWVLYNFHRFIYQDQSTDEGWSMVSRDVCYRHDNWDDNFVTPELIQAELESAMDERVGGRNWHLRALRGYGNEPHFPGFAGYAADPAHTYQTFLDMLGPRVGEALRQLDAKKVVDMCGFLRTAHRVSEVGDITYEERYEAGPWVRQEGWPHERWCRNPPAAYSTQLAVDVHEYQSNSHWPSRFHILSYVPSTTGEMIPIHTGARVYNCMMYLAHPTDSIDLNKLCGMGPVTFDTRGYRSESPPSYHSDESEDGEEPQASS